MVNAKSKLKEAAGAVLLKSKFEETAAESLQRSVASAPDVSLHIIIKISSKKLEVNKNKS